MQQIEQPAWIKIGVDISRAETISEALYSSELDYEVKKGALRVVTGHRENGELITQQILNRYATYREDTKEYLGGIVSDRYAIVQNADAFEFLQPLVDDGTVTFEKAGVIDGGRLAFLVVKLPALEVAGEKIEQRLMIYVSHDGSSAVTVWYLPYRLVCMNQLQASINDSDFKVSIRHSKNAKAKLKALSKTIELIESAGECMRASILKMIQFEIPNTTKFLGNLTNALFLTKEECEKMAQGGLYHKVLSTRKFNIINDFQNFYYKGVGQDAETCQSNAWRFYNAVTGYFQHVKTYSNDEQKFNAFFDGQANKIMQEALAYCLNPVTVPTLNSYLKTK